MRLVSWNVNGIRACIKKGFVDAMIALDADVICLQEIKASADQARAVLELPSHPFQFFNPAQRAGYSGTAVLSRAEPISVRMGLGDHLEDIEGRVITVEFDEFFLVTVYTTNSGSALKRLDYRVQVWDLAFRNYLKELEALKPVVCGGDLNVAHQAIDLARPGSNRRSAGFTNEERESFSGLLEAGFVDTFRHFSPETTAQYSWWSYRGGARARNVGWRLDYFLVSHGLLPRVSSSVIRPNVLGSDHCPVEVVLR
jgi:exodeoxyribonuclease-3